MVHGLSGAIEVAAGHHTACALTTGGRLRCWGSNESGMLGNGSTTDSLTPVEPVF